MDSIALLNDYATRIVQQHAAISREQALEIAVSLVTEAPSWPAFAASPSEPRLPDSVERYCAVITRTQRRIAALGLSPTRAARALLACECLAAMADSAQLPLQPLWQLLDAAGVAPIATLDAQGKTQAATAADGAAIVTARLGSWFFSKRRGERYPWNGIAPLAHTLGFSDAEAQCIREVQREAPQHSWDLALWFEVGILDPDPLAFLRELQAEPGWQARFTHLYATDGLRVRPV